MAVDARSHRALAAAPTAAGPAAAPSRAGALAALREGRTSGGPGQVEESGGRWVGWQARGWEVQAHAMLWRCRQMHVQHGMCQTKTSRKCRWQHSQPEPAAPSQHAHLQSRAAK